MASITNDAGGRWRIQFVAPDGVRKSIRMGKCDRKTAESVRGHVESLLSAKLSGQPLPRNTAAWLPVIGEALKAKLAVAGLIDAPTRALLGEFLRSQVLNRPDVKPATLEVWRQPCRNLIEFFGDDKPLRGVTAGDADKFKAWLLTQKLAPATLAKRLSFARTFFHIARKHRLVDENPFADVKIPSANVSHRQHFIDRATTQRLIEAATPTWRTIIALARYGGLRCPSEVLSLEWRHVDWGRGRVTVPSPKTDRYDGKGERVIPLYPELRGFLESALKANPAGQTHVIGGGHLAKADGPTGWKNCNLRTAFTKLVARAGLEPWPRLFHNLRSSRETELLEEFPLHVVAPWMGHTAKVSIKHYPQTTNDHFAKAAGGGAESGARVAHNAAQQPDADTRTEPQGVGVVPRIVAESAGNCEGLRDDAQVFSGEGGIRTHGRSYPTRL